MTAAWLGLRAPLKELRLAQRSLRTSVTHLREAVHRARYRDALELEVHKLQESAEELGRRIDAEQAAIDEPHAFERPLIGIWCRRCGGVLDRQELHPPELQVNEQSARAAQGGA